MNNVTRFENTKQRRLNWEQEEQRKAERRGHKKRRDIRKSRHTEFEENEE
ncbi:hypothetical protein PMW_19 [Pseudomonas phage phiPMW]|uniref:Uncharacterized protein n=1 Tax=Pseudomonas phage phiPMW TaxID=1815582 RepID=A0A1S5R158_9CAUD|nr:hypothetical protein FDG97_gp019 [Pseudomonas phage phiPMW]ANA49144.1 hypothetical protein PMW_19 [Pseudomonas phage phiPMW]